MILQKYKQKEIYKLEKIYLEINNMSKINKIRKDCFTVTVYCFLLLKLVFHEKKTFFLFLRNNQSLKFILPPNRQ